MLAGIFIPYPLLFPLSLPEVTNCVRVYEFAFEWGSLFSLGGFYGNWSRIHYCENKISEFWVQSAPLSFKRYLFISENWCRTKKRSIKFWLNSCCSWKCIYISIMYLWIYLCFSLFYVLNYILFIFFLYNITNLEIKFPFFPTIYK